MDLEEGVNDVGTLSVSDIGFFNGGDAGRELKDGLVDFPVVERVDVEEVLNVVSHGIFLMVVVGSSWIDGTT